MTPSDPNAFNTKLAKLLQGLKRDANALSIRQNYRGTGRQIARRQLWVRYADHVVDLWLETRSLEIGGVVGVTGVRISYNDRTPEEVYALYVAFRKAQTSTHLQV